MRHRLDLDRRGRRRNEGDARHVTSDGISWNNGISPSSEFANILPEEARLAEVSSNFWGTKFKIAGVDADEQLPSDLGQVFSHFLHLF